MTNPSKFNITFYFKDIFPSYSEFTEFLDIYTNINSEDVLNAYIFKYLYNRYCNSNINYDTIDAFLRHMGITYEDTFNQMQLRKNIIDAQYQITVEELTLTSRALSNTASLNIANNANNNAIVAIENPEDYIIPYINSQVTNNLSNENEMSMHRNKLKSYFEALDFVTTKYLTKFLNNFNKHFLTVFMTPIFNFD